MYLLINFRFNEMPGKKRKLKKELKRKLRKDIKKDNNDKKVDKKHEQKQVLDKQTLQQIMMTQMIMSRDRINKGDNTSWTTVQNQQQADKIKAQQEINALKAAKQEWERRARNIKENEQYKEMEEKLKQEIEERKKAVEQAQKLGPLKEQLRELEAQKAELERKLNDPFNQMQLDKINLENYIKHLKETVDASDPEYKKMSDKIAEAKVTLKKLKEREKLIETRNQLNTELKNKRSEMKAAFKQLRGIYPNELGGVQWNEKDIDNIIQKIIDNIIADIAKDETTLKKFKEQQLIGEEYDKKAVEFKRKQAEMKADMEYLRQQVPDVLTGVQWNAKDRDEKILEAKRKVAIDIDNMNKQLEILKETSDQMKILNQTKADRDIYEENFKKEHPLFNPIYEEKLSKYGENITVANRTDAFDEAIGEYKIDLITNLYDMQNQNDEISKLLKYIVEGRDLPDIVESSSENEDKTSSDNSDFDSESEDEQMSEGQSILEKTNSMKYDQKKVKSRIDSIRETLNNMSDNESVNENDSKDDELAAAQFGPGRE